MMTFQGEPFTLLPSPIAARKTPSVFQRDRMTFELRWGEIHGVIGLPGAGKSTLARQILKTSAGVYLGLIKKNPGTKELLEEFCGDAKIIVFDEATIRAAYPVQAQEVYTKARELAQQGKSVIFISHDIPEVLHLCDRVTVMRRTGRPVITLPCSGTNRYQLEEAMNFFS